MAGLLARSVWRRSAYRDQSRVRNARSRPGHAGRRGARRGAHPAGAEPRAGRRRPARRLHPDRRRAGHRGRRPLQPAGGAARRDRSGRRVLAVAPPPDPPVVPDPPDAARPATLDVGGAAVPGVAVTDPGATPWFALDARQRTGELPVSSPSPAAAGGRRARRGVRPGHRRSSPRPRRRTGARPPTGAARTRPAPPSRPAAGTCPAPRRGRRRRPPLASLPRAPVLTPMTQVLPRGTRAILDWPVAFVFPCLTPEPLPPGTAASRGGGSRRPRTTRRPTITYTPGLGGPFATARVLVTEHRMPTYLRGDPTRDGAAALPLGPDRAPGRARPPLCGYGRRGLTDGRTSRVPRLSRTTDRAVERELRAGAHHRYVREWKSAPPPEGPPTGGRPHRMTARPDSTDTVEAAARPDRPRAPGAVPADGAARAVLRAVGAGSRRPVRGRHARRGAPRTAPGGARPAQRGRHEHLLGPVPRHVLAALDRSRRGRGDRADHRHRPGAADGVGHEQGVAHRRRRGRPRRRRSDGAAGRADRPVRRRRRPLAGADHRVGPDDRRGRPVERRRRRARRGRRPW